MAGQQERFGERLRRYRESAGFSQEELAERAGLSANAISSLERGERKRPYPDTLRRLAEALHLGDEARSELAAALREAPSDVSVPGIADGRGKRPYIELPGEPTPFIGREREAGVVRHLLAHADGRLLTLIGPGGVGKSRLALHVAHTVKDQYADGAVWVELAPLGDSSLVLSTTARAIGLEDVARGDPATTLRSWLRDRHMLLVIDNLEHVLDAVPELAQLLLACTNLHLLATSRSPLKVRGEQEYLVPPLELPPAGPVRDERELAANSSVQFFIWQARQKNPAFALTPGNASIVAAICRRLDGLPLALELVAARIRILSPADVLARLDHLMPLLVGGARDLPQRQQTMRAAIAWSYDLLGLAEQSLFRRLSVFAGGWTLEAAEETGLDDTGRAGEVVDLLGYLIEQSLVTVMYEVPGTRYGMLEPVRQFALEQLEASGEAEDTRLRHARYCLDLAERAALEFESRAGQAAWLERLEREHDNLRVALAWCENAQDGAEIGLRLAAALWRFWEVRGHVDEGRRWLAAALTRGEEVAPDLRAKALNAAGNLARDQADHDRALVYHEQSLALRRQLGDTVGIATSLNNLGVIARDRGDPDQTLRLCLESLALYQSIGNQRGAAISLISLGMAAGQQEDYSQGHAYYDESLALFRALGDSWHIAWVLTYQAELLASQGEFALARPMAEESLALHRVASDAWGIATALGVLGKVAQARNDLDTAAGMFAEALRLLIGVRIERAIPACLLDLAGVLLASGQPDRAARLVGASEALQELIGVLPSPANGTAVAVELAGLRTGTHAAAWAEGRNFTRDQVNAEAMSLVEEIVQRHPASLPGVHIEYPSAAQEGIRAQDPS